MQFLRQAVIFALFGVVSSVGAIEDSSNEKDTEDVITTFSEGWGFPPDSQQEKSPAQPDHHLVGCPDSPTPGKRPPDAACAILAHKIFNTLPKAPIVLRLENFPTTEAVQNSATPASAVVEAAGKMWLLTLGSQGERSKAGSFVKEIGPLPEIPIATSYELQVADADFGPAMNPAISKAVHTHSGPEIWYLFTGQQCLETPNGIQVAKAGESMFAPAGTPMQLTITEIGNRSPVRHRSRCRKAGDHRVQLAAQGQLPEKCQSRRSKSLPQITA